jgi:hypothetical protein
VDLVISRAPLLNNMANWLRACGGCNRSGAGCSEIHAHNRTKSRRHKASNAPKKMCSNVLCGHFYHQVEVAFTMES